MITFVNRGILKTNPISSRVSPSDFVVPAGPARKIEENGPNDALVNKGARREAGSVARLLAALRGHARVCIRVPQLISV